MSTISTSSRIRGSLYGVAVADALGGPVEFHRRGSFRPVIGYRYNSNFDLAPGTWTDDTSMTLCLAQSLVEKDGKFVVHDQVGKYVKWKDHGYMSATGRCFDIGNATRQALGIWKVSADSDQDGGAAETERYQGLVNQSLNRKVRSSIWPTSILISNILPDILRQWLAHALCSHPFGLPPYTSSCPKVCC